jgi:hypothetical protein
LNELPKRAPRRPRSWPHNCESFDRLVTAKKMKSQFQPRKRVAALLGYLAESRTACPRSRQSLRRLDASHARGIRSVRTAKFKVPPSITSFVKCIRFWDCVKAV